ncbi:MAG: hypothetical protein RI883_1272 [Bacteroidota bacterium]|jgi:LPS O-antigen subunit length determinant protein (WzzB/FepE family)
MKYHFILCVLIVLYSCTDLKKGEQIQSIQEMNVTIDSIQTVLLENDYSTISDFASNANNTDSRIKMNYESDTLDLTFAKKLDSYNTMRKSFGILSIVFLQLSSDVKSEKITLQKLKLDIENGNGERDKYATFIQFENEKVSKLKTLLSDYISLRETTTNTYNKLHDEINSFSLSLSNNN